MGYNFYMAINPAIHSIVREYGSSGQDNQIDETDLRYPYKTAESKCNLNRQGIRHLGSLNNLLPKNPSDKERTEHFKQAKEIHKILEQIYGENYKIVKQGILAEVFVVTALKDLGFEVYQPTIRDDATGKIDCWANTKDGILCAVQVKSSAFISEIEVINPDADEDYIIDESVTDYRKDMQTMLDYISTEVNLPDNMKIKPLLIIVPGGENNEDAIYNQTTGLPLSGAADKLYEKIEKIIYTDEDF